MLSEYYICPKENLRHMYLLNYSNINVEKFEQTMKVLKGIIAKKHKN